MSAVLVWSIALGAIAGILFRPRDWPEAVWACVGAGLLVFFRLLSPASAWSAIGKGADVYLFLTGMMLLVDCPGDSLSGDAAIGVGIGPANGTSAVCVSANVRSVPKSAPLYRCARCWSPHSSPALTPLLSSSKTSSLAFVYQPRSSYAPRFR
jgi:arsenical pump membrane protein